MKRKTSRAAAGFKGRGVGSTGKPVETKTTRTRDRVLDRLNSPVFRQQLEELARTLWKAETGDESQGPLWLLNALRELPNYRLLPQNVHEEILVEVQQLLRRHVDIAEWVGLEGNARQATWHRNRKAAREAVEQAERLAARERKKPDEDELLRVAYEASLERFLSPEDAYVQALLSCLDDIARRYGEAQPVRILLDQDLGEDDALIQITIPARGFQRAINDARTVADVVLQEVEQNFESDPLPLFTRPQRTEGKHEPDELGEMLWHELCHYFMFGGIALIKDWLSGKQGSQRKLARILLDRKSWPERRLVTVEKRLSEIRPQLRRKDQATGELLWPEELGELRGFLRGDKGLEDLTDNRGLVRPLPARLER